MGPGTSPGMTEVYGWSALIFAPEGAILKSHGETIA